MPYDTVKPEGMDVRPCAEQGLGRVEAGPEDIYPGTAGRGKNGEGVRNFGKHQKGKDPGPHDVAPEKVLHHDT